MSIQSQWSTLAASVARMLKTACAATIVICAAGDICLGDDSRSPSIRWVERDEPFGSPLFEAPSAPLFEAPASQIESLPWDPLTSPGQAFESTLLFTQEPQPVRRRRSPILLVENRQDVAPPPFEPPSPSDGTSPSDAVPTSETPAAAAQAETNAQANDKTTFGREQQPETRQTMRWFLRTQSPLLRPGQLQFDAGIAYSQFQYAFPTIDSPTNVARADLRRRTIVSPFAFRYGLTENCQVFANIPTGYRNTELATAPISTPTPVDSSSAYGGVGDIYIGTNYRVVRGGPSTPDIIWTFAAGLPTGEKSVLTDVFQGGLGTGFASLSTSFLAVHSYDPVVVFWGGGWQYYFAGDLQGTPVQLGNYAFYQLGTGFAVNDRVTLSTAFLGGYVQQTKINGINLPDSQQEPMRMRFAVTVFRNGHIVEPFSEVGMTFTSPNARVGCTWTF